MFCFLLERRQTAQHFFFHASHKTVSLFPCPHSLWIYMCSYSVAEKENRKCSILQKPGRESLFPHRAHSGCQRLSALSLGERKTQPPGRGDSWTHLRRDPETPPDGQRRASTAQEVRPTSLSCKTPCHGFAEELTHGTNPRRVRNGSRARERLLPHLPMDPRAERAGRCCQTSTATPQATADCQRQGEHLSPGLEKRRTANLLSPSRRTASSQH